MSEPFVPSFSESIYAMMPEERLYGSDEGHQGGAPPDESSSSTSACSLAGTILVIVALSLIVWMIVRLATGGGNFTSTPPPGGGPTLTDLATPADLDALRTNSKANVCVLAYANGCGYCTQFMPEFTRAAKAGVPSVMFARFQVGSQWKEVMRQYNITGVPEVLRFKSNGQVDHFKGARTAESVLAFASH